MHDIAFSRVVWAHACSTHVISNGYPFPNTPLNQLSTRDLIHNTNHAYSLAKRWTAGVSKPRQMKYISGTSGTSVSDVHFVPGHDDSLLLTISKVIWSVLDIWFIDSDNPQKVCEWSPRGAIFTGFALNSDKTSEATIAISIHLNEYVCFHLSHSPCRFKPMSIECRRSESCLWNIFVDLSTRYEKYGRLK